MSAAGPARRRAGRTPRGFRRGLLAAALLVLAPAAGRAQEAGRFEVSGGYSFLGSSAIVDGAGAGWAAGGAWNAAPWLALTVEAGWNAQRQDVGLFVAEAGFLSLFAGPRFSWSSFRMRPFVQALAGRTDVNLRVTSDFPVPSTGDAADSSPALQIGGGVDVPAHGGLAVRIALDYRRVFAPEPFTQRRALTAVVYSFPRRPRPPAAAGARAAP